MPKGLKRIKDGDTEFISNGKTYYILGDDFAGYKRLALFLEMLPVIGIGKTSMDLMNSIRTAFQIGTTGEQLLKSHFEQNQYLFNVMQGANDTNSPEHFYGNLDLYLEFCSLFCVTENEDLTSWSKAQAKRKIADWQKDMNMLDFFLLAKKRVPWLPQILLDIDQHLKKGKPK